MSNINDIIRARKSVYPPKFLDKEIPKDILMELLENGNHAPTHKLTEPWRFKIFSGAGRKKLSDFMVEKYKAITSNPQESKIEKIALNVSQSAVVIAIIMHRDLKERVPEWEEVASLAMAMQNIWISLQQYQLGGYWSSPPYAKLLNELVAMEENERCLGFFYLGYCEPDQKVVKKGAIQDKIEWIDS